MKKIQCELCGSPDIVMIESGFFQCQHCGCKYTKEQLQVVLSGVVETTVGNAELERLVENAQAQMQMKNYDEALAIIDELKKQFPKDYRSYWLFFRCLFEECISSGYLNLERSYRNARGLRCNASLLRFNHAYNELCSAVDHFGGMERSEIDRYVEKNSQMIYDMLVSGEMNCRWNGDIQADSLPVLKKAYDMGIENAKKIHSFGLRYPVTADPAEELCLLLYGYEIEFLLGKTICFYEPYASVSHHWHILKNNFTLPSDKKTAKTLAMANEAKYIEKYNLCPQCGRSLKKGMFGYACTNCKYRHM